MSFARCISAISAGDLIIAAARGDRRRQHEPAGRRRGAQAVGDEEADALFDADRAGRDAAVLQDARDELAPQSSSSCHTRTSSVNLVISRARASSKPGAT